MRNSIFDKCKFQSYFWNGSKILIATKNCIENLPTMQTSLKGRLFLCTKFRSRQHRYYQSWINKQLKINFAWSKDLVTIYDFTMWDGSLIVPVWVHKIPQWHIMGVQWLNIQCRKRVCWFYGHSCNSCLITEKDIIGTLHYWFSLFLEGYLILIMLRVREVAQHWCTPGPCLVRSPLLRFSLLRVFKTFQKYSIAANTLSTNSTNADTPCVFDYYKY